MIDSPAGRPLRLFIALALSPEARDALAVWTQALADAGIPGVRAVAPDALHLTLKFLGQVDPGRVPALADSLDEVCADAPPATVTLRRAGAFPDMTAPRVVWIGADEAEALRALAARVDEACAAVGFARERRPLKPHVTLARVGDRAAAGERGRVGAALTGHAPPPSFTAGHIDLVRSDLRPKGPRYTTLHRAALTGG